MRIAAFILIGVIVLGACTRSTSEPASPSIQHVYPATIQAGESYLLLIKGNNFAEGAQVILGGVQMEDVIWVNPTLLTVRLARGISQGRYEVSVRNPNGLASSKEDALVVKPAPPRPVVTRPWPDFPVELPAWQEWLNRLRKHLPPQTPRFRQREADDIERRFNEIERQFRKGRLREAEQHIRDLVDHWAN